jgi:uncharacterized protein
MSNMLARLFKAAALAVTLAGAIGGTAVAQQPAAAPAPAPTPSAIAMAREILVLKGATQMWDPVIPAVIDRARTMFLQSNINLAKEINEVAATVRTQLAPRAAELQTEVARMYAQRFTEAELKELVAFYKSPLGKKVISEEPQVIDASAARILEWGNKFSDEVIVKMRAEMKKKGHDL